MVSGHVDERRCAETLDQLPERIVRYRRRDLGIVYCNAAWAAGYDLAPEEVTGRTLDAFLTADEMARLGPLLARLGADCPKLSDTVPRPAPGGRDQWVEWVEHHLPGDGGPDDAEVLAVGRDVSDRHHAELELAESEARFRQLADKSADVVWRFLVEPHPHFDYVSPSMEKSLGYPPSYFLDDFSRFLEVLGPESRAAVERAFEGHALPERSDFEYRCADGSTVIGEMHVTPIRGGLQGVSRDVTELRRLQADLADHALRDPLTGLANRRLLGELLATDLERAKRGGSPLVVAFLDLDGLKAVNDTHGHDAGDLVLCEAARRLRSSVRGADSVARVGGDEFVVVYQPGTGGADRLLARIDEALAAPVVLPSGATVRCPASIGTAVTSSVGHDAAALLAAADAAMYEVKRSRRPAASGGSRG